MDDLLMKYFVLKPKGNDEYAAASRVAMHGYARRIRGTNKSLSDSLIEWAASEGAETWRSHLPDAAE